MRVINYEFEAAEEVCLPQLGSGPIGWNWQLDRPVTRAVINEACETALLQNQPFSALYMEVKKLLPFVELDNGIWIRN